MDSWRWWDGLAVATALVLAAPVLISVGPAHGAVPPHVSIRSSPGCARRAPATAERTLAFSADGDNGTYVEQVPTVAVPGKALPVIFDFHAYQEPGQLQVTFSNLGAYGQNHGFVTVTPWIDKQKIPHWFASIGSRDMDWFGHLLTHVEATACIDENRVFVTGYSNGAFMASAIACQYSSRVAAVAPVAGIVVAPHCRKTRPVPVVAFHGTADPLIHYNGSPSKAAQDLPAPDGSGSLSLEDAKKLGTTDPFKKVPTIPAEAADWAKNNGCKAKKASTRIAGQVSLLTWSCPHHADVALYRIQGGGHTWPGSTESAAIAKVVGPTTFEISADVEMWKFFRVHPLTASD